MGNKSNKACDVRWGTLSDSNLGTQLWWIWCWIKERMSRMSDLPNSKLAGRTSHRFPGWSEVRRLGALHGERGENLQALWYWRLANVWRLNVVDTQNWMLKPNGLYKYVGPCVIHFWPYALFTQCPWFRDTLESSNFGCTSHYVPLCHPFDGLPIFGWLNPLVLLGFLHSMSPKSTVCLVKSPKISRWRLPSARYKGTHLGSKATTRPGMMNPLGVFGDMLHGYLEMAIEIVDFPIKNGDFP